MKPRTSALSTRTLDDESRRAEVPKDCHQLKWIALAAACVLASCSGEDPDTVNIDEQELAEEQVGQPLSSEDMLAFEELARAHPSVVEANRCVAIMHEFGGARRLTELDEDQIRSNLAEVDEDAAAKWLSIALDRELTSGLSKAELSRIQEDALLRAREMESAELAQKAEKCAQEIPASEAMSPPNPAEVPPPQNAQPE